MSSTKKYFSLLIIILTLLAVPTLTSCKKQESTDQKTIEFWTLQLTGFSKYINNIITKYEAQNPGIKIKWIDVPFSEGEKRALASIMSKNPPDIINLNPNFALTLASKGGLEDLTPYLNKNELNAYIEQAWDACSFDKKIFGVPWYVTTPVTIYNIKILKDAGLDKNDYPKNYAELKQYATKIKQKTGKYAFYPNITEDGKIIKLFNKYNIEILNQNNQAAFNTPKALNLLKYWQDLYKQNLIPTEAINLTHRESLERYLSGQSAYIFTGANFLKIIKENAPQVYANSLLAPQITGENNKFDFSLMNLVIPLKSKNKKEALDFVLYLTNSKNQLEFSKLAPILPSTIDALNNEYFKQIESKNLMDKAGSISADQLKDAITPIPSIKNKKDLYEIADVMVQSVLLNQKSPKQALNDCEKEWNKILKEN